MSDHIDFIPSFHPSMGKKLLFVFIFNLLYLFNIPAGAAEAALCQQTGVLEEAKAYQELVIPEADFNLSQTLEAIQYLHETLPSLIDEAKKPAEIAENPMYYVKYPKSVILIEGYLYLQQYQQAVLMASVPTTDVKTNLQKIETAKKTFCDFYELNMLSAD